MSGTSEASIAKRGYHEYTRTTATCTAFTVADNENFLTQRLSSKRTEKGTIGRHGQQRLRRQLPAHLQLIDNRHSDAT